MTASMNEGISRRGLFKIGALAGVAALGANYMVACAPKMEGNGKSGGSGSGSDDFSTPSFLKRPEAITDFAETKDYDIVVVGAGAAGVPCALAAFENGAKVAVLQKESRAISQGNFCGGILLDQSDPAGVAAITSAYVASNHHSAKRKIVDIWAKNSGEAVSWLFDRAQKANAQVVNVGNALQMAVTNINGYKVNYITAFFGPKPYTFGDGIAAVADYAQQQGVDFYYSTPGVQLITAEDGSVTGVIGQSGKDYIRFNASKGVVLACGDFQNDDEMCEYFIPGLENIDRKCSGRTGDGHKMGYWAGAALSTVYSKMVHDMDAGPVAMMDQPQFLCVNESGERFAPETIGMYVTNNYTTDDGGKYTQVFGSNYMDYADRFPGLTSPEDLQAYMPEYDGAHPGVFEGFIATYKADTLEELADKLGLDRAAFVASVNRYNELCAKGADEDFGKPASCMIPIEKAPFYGIHRHVRLSCIDGGLIVDENLQCLNAKGEPIKGLYAVGVVGAGSSGGDNWLAGGQTGSTCVGGTALGRSVTGGYVVGKRLAAL